MYLKIKLIILSVSLCIGICLICSCDNQKKLSINDKALKKAVEFSGTEFDIKELGQTFTNRTIPAKGLVWHSVGKDNLSSFLLTLNVHPNMKIEQYEIKFDTTSNSHPKNCLLKGKSLVSFRNLTNIKWPSNNNGIGIFTFKGYGVSGKCYFRATETEGIMSITKLAIAKKKSNRLEDGIIVFTNIKNKQ